MIAARVRSPFRFSVSVSRWRRECDRTTKGGSVIRLFVQRENKRAISASAKDTPFAYRPSGPLDTPWDRRKLGPKLGAISVPSLAKFDKAAPTPPRKPLSSEALARSRLSITLETSFALMFVNHSYTFTAMQSAYRKKICSPSAAIRIFRNVERGLGVSLPPLLRAAAY